MKRLCFGSLFKIIYQARANKVTQTKICTMIAKGFGVNYEFDSAGAGHLLSCHDNPPLPLVDGARKCDIESVVQMFEENVIPLINAAKQKEVIRAIQIVIKEDDNIPDDTNVGIAHGYEKKNLINSTHFVLADLLCNVFYYAITQVTNKQYSAEMKEFDKEFVNSLSEEAKGIRLSSPNDAAMLSPTLNNPALSTAFMLCHEGVIVGLPNYSTAQIYSANVRNYKFDFKNMKQYLFDNITSYVFSRVRIIESDTPSKSMRLGANGIVRFLQIYKDDAEAVLGELLLYIFLEHELKAPKIMSRVEIEDINGRIQSRSEGIHLLAPADSGLPCHQLVCGASNICGDLHDAVDRAFEKIAAIESHSDEEFQFITNSSHNSILTPDTTAYLVDLLIPKENGSTSTDMSFGVFLGYTAKIDSENLSNDQYRAAVQCQLNKDVKEIKDYVSEKVKDLFLQGYSFYFYVVPFNDADKERKSIIDEILAGG